MFNVNRLRYHYQNVLRQDLLLKCPHSNIMKTPELRKGMIMAQVPYDSVNQKRLALEILCAQKAVHFAGRQAFLARKMPQIKSSISKQKQGTSKGSDLRRRISRTALASLARSRFARTNSLSNQPREISGNSNFTGNAKRAPGSLRSPRVANLSNFVSSFHLQKGLRHRGGFFPGKHSAWPRGDYSVRVSLRDESFYNFIDKLVTVICFQDFPIKIKGNIIELTIASNILRLFPEIQNHFDLFSVQNLQIIIMTSAKNQEETRLVWTGLFQKEIENYDKANY